jgi:hypothetical protein
LPGPATLCILVNGREWHVVKLGFTQMTLHRRCANAFDLLVIPINVDGATDWWDKRLRWSGGVADG